MAYPAARLRYLRWPAFGTASQSRFSSPSWATATPVPTSHQHQKRNASSSKPRSSKHNTYLSSHGDSGVLSDPSSPSSIHIPNRPKRLVVGVTGATGTVFAIRLLEMLRELGVETHVVMSKWAMATGKYETPMLDSDVRQLATYSYSPRDLSAPIASGSFVHDGMLVVPCSMKTLAAIRIGYCDDLISRAADVCLKENRRLLLAVRETPLSDIHLDNMLHLRRAGAVIFPPVPAFYTRPKSLDDIITQSVGRMLDSFGIHTNGFERWDGFDWKSKQMS